MASSTVSSVDKSLWKSTNLLEIPQHAECCYQRQSIDYGHIPKRVHAVFQAEVMEAAVEEGSVGSAEGIVEGPGPAVAVLQRRRTVKARVGKIPLKPGGPCARCSVSGTLASHWWLYLQRPCHTQHCSICAPYTPSSYSANHLLTIPTHSG